MTAPAPILKIEGLSHRFPDGVLGLESIDLSIGPGEFVVVAGENGAGKTLLMRHLVGLAEPTTGRILFEGSDIKGRLAEVRRSIGLVFQDSGAQVLGLTIGEEIAFGPKNLGWPRDKIAHNVEMALAVTGLGGREREYCGHLSGGEKRRLAIAGILAMEPKVLVLDEPFAGLDYPAVVSVLGALVASNESGRTIIVLTHELEKCLAHAHRLVLLSRSRILAEGRPESVWDDIPRASVHRPRGGSGDLGRMTWLAETA